jgi:UDP-N-acetyl-D-mannosaminuronic acid transferase (WecB/TagA/CpsF family)
MVDFHINVRRLYGQPFDAVTVPGLFETLCLDSAHHTRVGFFSGPESIVERACKKLNTEGSSALAFHEEPR